MNYTKEGPAPVVPSSVTPRQRAGVNDTGNAEKHRPRQAATLDRKMNQRWSEEYSTLRTERSDAADAGSTGTKNRCRARHGTVIQIQNAIKVMHAQPVWVTRYCRQP